MEPTTVQIVDRGRHAVARQAHVNAGADELFTLLANPHRHHEVDGSGTVKADIIGPRELELGDKFRVSMRMRGVPYAITSTVVALEPGRVVEWQHPGKHTWRWEFEPQPDGSTLVTEIFDYSTSRAPWLIERINAPARNAVSMTKTLHRLQQLYA